MEISIRNQQYKFDMSIQLITKLISQYQLNVWGPIIFNTIHNAMNNVL